MIAVPRMRVLPLIALLLVASAMTSMASDNIAPHRPYTLSPAPNYDLCTDPGDMKQLTDGVLAPNTNSIWASKETVGWYNYSPVIITIDLGSRQPISGVSFHTAARSNSGVYWPKSITVLVSDDGEAWRHVGDLRMLSAKHGLPPTPRAADDVHRFESREMQASGRYVALAVVITTPYLFCDEIEVYRGPDSLLSQEPIGQTRNGVDGIRHFAESDATRFAMAERLRADLAAVQAKDIEWVGQMERKILELPSPDPDTFKAIFPLNDTHAKILAAFGVNREWRGLLTGKQHRFTPLTWLAESPKAEPPAIAIEMMGNEFRSDAILLTNASDEPTVATMRVKGVPGAPRPSWLNVSSVAWTDTQQGVPVAEALIEAEFGGGVYSIPLPAGLTRKVWMTVDSSQLAAGDHKGTLQIETFGKRSSAPFRVRVSKIRMARPRLSLGMWDYSDARNLGYGITTHNAPAAVALMRSHFVDSPWASMSALLLPQSPGQAHSFAVFDEWIARWPNARNYLVFVNVGNHFAGAQMDTAEFRSRVGEWAKTLAEHMRELRLQPAQLGLLLVDEPNSDAQFAISVAWANAIKAAAPELTIFSTPNWAPTRSAIQDEAFALFDIACLGPRPFAETETGAAVQEYFAARCKAGQQLWFYQCSGPTRLLDPDSYYRRLAWRAFRYGATGIGLWSFSDTGGARTAWNEYTQPRMSYSPVFLGVNDATDTVQWQAVREGVEDYEYLAMLRDSARASKDESLRARAESLLTEAGRVVGVGTGIPYNDKAVKTSAADADTYRLRVLKLLEELAR